ncbi:MAG: hypothetical protein JWN39_1683 [Ilumatobacteraceae bacterium]|nr:hypothetical protein [Ilumatobacteraceae bacterium]
MVRRRRRCGNDAGQAIGLVLISIALIGGAAVGIVRVSRHVTQRALAQTAADAAALAGVAGGELAASAAAGRNGAALQGFERGTEGDGFVVTVDVSVGDEHAVARASSGP